MTTATIPPCAQKESCKPGVPTEVAPDTLDFPARRKGSTSPHPAIVLRHVRSPDGFLCLCCGDEITDGSPAVAAYIERMDDWGSTVEYRRPCCYGFCVWCGTRDKDTITQALYRWIGKEIATLNQCHAGDADGKRDFDGAYYSAMNIGPVLGALQHGPILAVDETWTLADGIQTIERPGLKERSNAG